MLTFNLCSTTESCLALLNNLYNDGVRDLAFKVRLLTICFPQVKWHDVACYHRKHVLCEDSETLLDYVKATNEGIEL